MADQYTVVLFSIDGRHFQSPWTFACLQRVSCVKAHALPACDGFDSDLIAKIDASLRIAVHLGYIDKMATNVSDLVIRNCSGNDN